VERLKTHSQFQAVLAGRIVARTPHFALHVLETDADPSVGTSAQEAAMTAPTPPLRAKTVWIGALVPKRWAKRAATRNAVRRQIYQVSRGFEPALRPCALVVRLRATFDRARFLSASSPELKQAVRVELEQLFSRIAVLGAERAA
jgi:ribonuclease P protein component